MTMTSISPPDVIVNIKDSVGIISLNRPERMNSFTASARSAIIASLKALDANSEVNAIILRGADATSFSSGQNLDEARAVTVSGIAPWQEHQRAMYQAIRDLEKPCVAAVDGICVGGACTLPFALIGGLPRRTANGGNRK
ncbi:enoyl-CoA hydratase/carnithine racemase [Bradyrhizobium sp. LA2.1]